MRTMIILAAMLMMMGCGGINNTKQMSSLPDIVQLGQNILSRDSVEQAAFPVITEDQRSGLTRFTSLDVPESTLFIGERAAGNGFTLEAYKVPTGEDPNQFKVYLITRDKKDVIVNFLDLHEFHTSEHKRPMTFGGNRFYTTDAHISFDGQQHFTLHRVMTLTSLYLKNHTLTELWRVEWDNRYEIDDNGKFKFIEQEETTRTEGLDDPMIEEYQSRDISK